MQEFHTSLVPELDPVVIIGSKDGRLVSVIAMKVKGQIVQSQIRAFERTEFLEYNRQAFLQDVTKDQITLAEKEKEGENVPNEDSPIQPAT